jgi:cob(I)alamin adenosyltransferase
MYFDTLIETKKFKNVEDAIAKLNEVKAKDDEAAIKTEMENLQNAMMIIGEEMQKNNQANANPSGEQPAGENAEQNNQGN